MLSSRMPSISAFAGTIAVSLLAWVPTASSGSPSPVEDEARYLPIQTIGYDFGSKSMSGYFVQQADTCVVTLMIAEKRDPEETPAQSSPTRVRLVLYPQQIAGLDSEEGRSLNITCGEAAATLVVDVGERDRLVALQALAPKEAAAESNGLAELH